MQMIISMYFRNSWWGIGRPDLLTFHSQNRGDVRDDRSRRDRDQWSCLYANRSPWNVNKVPYVFIFWIRQTSYPWLMTLFIAV